MAIAAMIDAPNFVDLFRRRVLSNLRYWQEYVASHAATVAALDQERERIITAVLFALELAEAWPDAYELITHFSPYIERRGSWETWNRLLNRAVEVAQQRGDAAGAITLSGLLARLLQRQSQAGPAISHYRQTIRLARQTGNRFEEARACTNLGYLFIEQGRRYRAEVLCCHALALFEKLDNNHGRAHTENHLGILYTRQGHWEQARQHLERACAIWQAMPDHHGLMRGFINLSLLYNEMERPAQALDYLAQALELAGLTGDELETAKIYVNMGIAHRLAGKPAQAEAHARQAEAVFRRFANSAGLAEAWDNLGLACLDQGKWQEAGLYLQAALQAWRKLGNVHYEIRSLTYLVEYEFARGNRAQAMARWDELESLLSRFGQLEQLYELRLRFAKYRRSPPEQPSGQAAAK